MSDYSLPILLSQLTPDQKIRVLALDYIANSGMFVDVELLMCAAEDLAGYIMTGEIHVSSPEEEDQNPGLKVVDFEPISGDD